ncbi:cytochrome P450 family protein [Goodfellowiella coeruleoviolacea]|uniref:Cytochrome P450 n=1 Tax=Goodfellowiella coeruleoviolacea TaxID=334858 RepID=A0AAE3KHY6_9PSEU|nr:cytochrome P450 [Goodfellowiella coeruleoviolacea]MCP2167915.1 hypothetical protein [Goodfellowiella coeruleoviolacea]
MSTQEFATHSPGTAALTFDDAYFANPYPTLARLREASPVHRVTTPDGHPAWLVTREADVRAGLADPRLALDKAHARDGYRGFSLPPALDASLLNRDGADHARLRRLVSGSFTPRRVEALRARVAAIAEGLADRVAGALAEHGRADLVAEFAVPLPLAVVGDMLGVPEADRRAFAQWTTGLLAPRHHEQAAESVRAIQRFLVALIAARRAEPGEDLLSAWISARDEDDRLSENELVSMAFLVLLAGIENVTHAISHGTVVLLRHPGQLAALRADADLLSSAVEELLRVAVPAPVAIRRFATEDLEIGGVRIPAGDTVMLGVASAHRDAARFTDPDRVDLGRADNPHLAFGYGPHYCVGAPLARIELRVAFATLLRRFPNLALAVPEDELRWRPSFRSHGLLELPVTG